jgi:Tat protein translocase TatB subunit
MGNFGWTEMFFIAILALVLFGPRRLPEMGRKLGKLMSQLRNASDQFKQAWDDELEKEGLKDVQNRVQKGFSPSSFLDDNSSSGDHAQEEVVQAGVEASSSSVNFEPAISSSETVNTSRPEIVNLSNNNFLNPPIGDVIHRSSPSSNSSSNSVFGSSSSNNEEPLQINIIK